MPRVRSCKRGRRRSRRGGVRRVGVRSRRSGSVRSRRSGGVRSRMKSRRYGGSPSLTQVIVEHFQSTPLDLIGFTEKNLFTIEVFKVTYERKTGTFTWADIINFLHKQTGLLTNPKPLPSTFTRAAVTLEEKKERIQAVIEYVRELVTELVRTKTDTYPKLLTETFQGDIFSDRKSIHSVHESHELFTPHTDYTNYSTNSGGRPMLGILYKHSPGGAPQNLRAFTDENVQCKDEHNNTLLHALCYTGYVDPFKKLLKHLNESASTIDDVTRKSLFETNTDGLNPFMIAVLRGRFEMVCVLLNTLTFGSTQIYYDEQFGKDLNPDHDPLFNELCNALDSNLNTLGAKPSDLFCESQLFEMSEESTKRILINANLPAESPVVIAELIRRYLESAPTKLFNTNTQLINYDFTFPQNLTEAERNVYFKTLLNIWGKLGYWNEHFKNEPSKIAGIFLPILYKEPNCGSFRKLSRRLLRSNSTRDDNQMMDKLIKHIDWATQREKTFAARVNYNQAAAIEDKITELNQTWEKMVGLHPGLETEGLFQIAPSDTQDTCHTHASKIKEIISTLPTQDSRVTFPLYTLLGIQLEFMKQFVHDGSMEKLQPYIVKPGGKVFVWLFDHLKQITQHSSQNNMTAEALGVALGGSTLFSNILDDVHMFRKISHSSTTALESEALDVAKQQTAITAPKSEAVDVAQTAIKQFGDIKNIVSPFTQKILDIWDKSAEIRRVTELVLELENSP